MQTERSFGPDARFAAPLGLASLAPAGCVAPTWQGAAAPRIMTFTLRQNPVRPAGAVTLTEGVPPANYVGGRWQMRASLLQIDKAYVMNPRINTATFPAVLSRCLGEIITGASAAPGSASAAVGGAATINLSPGFLEVDRNYTGHWITVTATVVSPNAFTLDQVNRAVARALGQTMTWNTPPAGLSAIARPPPDGAMLHELLSTSSMQGGGGPCSGGWQEKVWARGCVRLVPDNSPATPITMTPVPAPAAPATTGGSTGGTAPVAPVTLPTPAQSCVVAPREGYYLRASATFDRTGPLIAAGTPTLVIGQTNLTQRGASGAELRLYRVRVNAGAHVGQEGFAAMSQADLQPASVGSCPTGTAIAAYAIATGGGGGSSPATTTPTTPRPTTPSTSTPATNTVRTQPTLAQLTGGTSSNVGWYLGGTAAVLAVISSLLYWKRRELGLSEEAPKAKKASPGRTTANYQVRSYT